MDIDSWEFWRVPPMATVDFFRACLDAMIDLCQPFLALVATLRLAISIPWVSHGGGRHPPPSAHPLQIQHERGE